MPTVMTCPSHYPEVFLQEWQRYSLVGSRSEKASYSRTVISSRQGSQEEVAEGTRIVEGNNRNHSTHKSDSFLAAF